MRGKFLPMRSLAASAPASAITGPSPLLGRRPVRKSPSTRAGCSRPFVALLAIVVVLHCSVLSGLSPWLAGYHPFTLLLFDSGPVGARPGEGSPPRLVGAVRASLSPGEQETCTCLEPGNPRPSRNGYACRMGDGTEAGEGGREGIVTTDFCPLRLACVPNAEWPWLGPKERPCAMWDGLEWEYNAKHTPKTNVWAAAPITREAPPIEGTARLPIVGLARLRHLTAAAGARLRRAQTRF